jgi:hypothetical protein
MQWLPARFISFPPPLPQLTGGSCNKAVTVLLLLGEVKADHLFKAHQGEGDHDQLTLSGLVTGIWELVSSPALSFLFLTASQQGMCHTVHSLAILH